MLFLDCLTSSDSNTIEDMGYEITQLEELVLHDRVSSDFNLQLLHMKKNCSPCEIIMSS